MLFCEQVLALPRIVMAPFSVKRVSHPVLTLSEICLWDFAMYYQTICSGVLPTFQFIPSTTMVPLYKFIYVWKYWISLFPRHSDAVVRIESCWTLGRGHDVLPSLLVDLGMTYRYYRVFSAKWTQKRGCWGLKGFLCDPKTPKSLISGKSS